MDLNALLAGANVTPTTSSKKPVGAIKVTLGGMTLFSRSLWQEATSNDAVANELNDLALSNPDKAKEIIKALLSKAEIEISGTGSGATSLADLVESLK